MNTFENKYSFDSDIIKFVKDIVKYETNRKNTTINNEKDFIKQIIKIRKYTLKYGYDFNEYISTQIVKEFPKYNAFC